MLEQPGDAADQHIELRPRFDFIRRRADHGAEEAFVIGDGNNFGALHALDQHFDVAIGQLQTLNDVDNRTDRVNLVRFGFVDGSIVLGGEEDFLVAGHSLFERLHARFASHYERGHHVRKDDHVADGHHRQTFCIGFFL